MAGLTFARDWRWALSWLLARVAPRLSEMLGQPFARQIPISRDRSARGCELVGLQMYQPYHSLLPGCCHSRSFSFPVVFIGVSSRHHDRACLLSRSSGDVQLMTSASHPPSVRPHYDLPARPQPLFLQLLPPRNCHAQVLLWAQGQQWHGAWCNSGWAHARPENVSRTLSILFCRARAGTVCAAP